MICASSITLVQSISCPSSHIYSSMAAISPGCNVNSLVGVVNLPSDLMVTLDSTGDASLHLEAV